MLVRVPRAIGAAETLPVPLETGQKLPVARERRRRPIQNDDVEAP